MRNLFAAFAAAALCLSSAAGAAFAATPSAEPVLAAASTALGAQNLDRLPSFHATVTGTGAGLPAKGDWYVDLSKNGAFATYLDFGVIKEGEGFDGSVAWQRDSSGVVWVDGSQQGRDPEVNEAFRESYALWRPSHGGAAVTLLAPQSEGAKTFDVVRVAVPDSVVPFDVWIDRATHLPARYVETAAAVTTTTTLDDYRPVAGVRLPYVSKQSTTQGNELDVTVSHIDIAPTGLAANVRKPETNVHDYSIAGGTETTVPVELIDNHVYLDVMLNGKGPYHFIFDSGGEAVIDPAVAREIGSSAKGSARGSGVGATTEDLSFAPVSSLRVGQAELRDQVFAVLPVRAGFGVAGSAPVDGIIGAEVFARFVTVFDYAHKRVTLKMPGAAVTGKVVPFVFTGTQPLMPCTIDGIAAQCSVDTGSRASIDLFSPFIAEHPSVVPAGASAPGVDGFGVGGGDIGRLGRLQSLGIAGFQLDNLVAGFSNATAGAFAVPGIAANVGGGVFKRFTLTFDYPHQTIAFEPNASLGDVDEYERSGMFVVNQGKIVVADVRPGTPAAAAGIVKGDVIESLDGTPAAQLTLGSVREAFHRPAGTQVKLEILVKGATAPRPVTLTLRNYV